VHLNENIVNIVLPLRQTGFFISHIFSPFSFSNSFHLAPSALTSCLASFSPWSSLSSTSLIGGRTCFSRTRTTEDDPDQIGEKRSLLSDDAIRPYTSY
jgi:hypothetical protein